MNKITSQNPIDPKKEQARQQLVHLFKSWPGSVEDLLVNTNLFTRSGVLAKILFLDEIYKLIKDIPGNIFEFGMWLGSSTVTFENLRAVYEPYNLQRKIVGFDTFSGYKSISDDDVKSTLFERILEEETYTTPKNYKEYFEKIMSVHEEENFGGHIKKHEVIEGDVVITIRKYLEQHPHTVVALAYFDMALEMPTYEAIINIKNHLIPGSILVFDEFNHREYPGETIAFHRIKNEFKYEIVRSKILPDRAIVKINEIM